MKIKLLLVLTILFPFSAIANERNELEDILGNNEYDHCFVLANRAYLIMGLRQDGIKLKNLKKDVLTLSDNFDKEEINKLIDEAYKQPIIPDMIGSAVVMSNFMSDVGQRCMLENPN